MTVNAKHVSIGYVQDDERYWLGVTINGEELDLGSYATANEAGEAMVKWLSDRNLTTAPGSGARLAEAQARNAAVVTFDVCTREEFEDRTASVRL